MRWGINFLLFQVVVPEFYTPGKPNKGVQKEKEPYSDNVENNKGMH